MLLESHVPAKLGSYADGWRMQAVARTLCEILRSAGAWGQTEAQSTLRAVRLSKCDLTTQMVEFPELRGVVGGLYAGGEAQEVSDAIYDPVQARESRDNVPSLPGAVLSVVRQARQHRGRVSVGPTHGIK